LHFNTEKEPLLQRTQNIIKNGHEKIQVTNKKMETDNST